MPLIIDENNIFDWQTEGFDRFLRKTTSPFLKDYTFTEKGGRFGIEMVSKNTSIMPRVIDRARLDNTAIAHDEVLSIQASIVVQASSGFQLPFTDFLFTAQWDGTNYWIRRFNRIDFETYTQDGFLQNTGLPENPNQIWGIAVQPDYIFVAWRNTSGVNKISKFGYNLNHIETKQPSIAFTTMICADDKFIYGLATSPNRILKYDFGNNTITTITWNITEPFPNHLLLFDGDFFYGLDTANNVIKVFKISPDNTISFIANYGIIDKVQGLLNTDNILRVVIEGNSQVVIKPFKI
ncbi:MAG: hypothetical protein KatS3mg096_765 [Candidatus Parcubacteria bacterium]|nr:MAG: hypothetical protein KatS3mg096_765 [Candidatus Parcubacteria bacterium]